MGIYHCYACGSKTLQIGLSVLVKHIHKNIKATIAVRNNNGCTLEWAIMEVWGLETTFFCKYLHVLQIGPIMEVRGLEATKLYIPSRYLL